MSDRSIATAPGQLAVPGVNWTPAAGASMVPSVSNVTVPSKAVPSALVSGSAPPPLATVSVQVFGAAVLVKVYVTSCADAHAGRTS